MKVTKRIKMVALAMLLTLGLGGSAIGVSYAASNSKAQASDLETKDGTKASTSVNVQDNGQDGEANDSLSQ